MDPALAAMLTDVVQHREFLGQDGYGAPVYGPPTLRPCRVEFKVQPVRTAQGTEATSQTQIFFEVDFTLQLRDELVLEDDTAPQIQAVQQYKDEFGNRHHQTALL